MRINIKKIKSIEGGAPPAELDSTQEERNKKHQSVAIEYWIEGELVNGIRVGECVVVARDIRNGIKVDGIFHTSPVKKLSKTRFSTANSVYIYKAVEKPNK